MENEKKKWPNKDQYKWRKPVVLTLGEGAQLEQILQENNCANVSQLCKKIAKREIVVCNKK